MSTSTSIPRITYPELFFGFVSPIGADNASTVNEFRRQLEQKGYRVVDIKVTEIFDILSKYIIPKTKLEKRDRYERFHSYIAYGNQLREAYTDDVLAVASIIRLIRQRIRVQKDNKFAKTAYLLYQFKRKEEIELLRSVYGRLFFQVSIYSRRGARVDFLARDFAASKNESGPYRYRDLAEKIVQDDENEVGQDHGQRVAKIFHDADLIVSLDTPRSIESQVSRMCELIFGSNTISPTHMEYGMYLAKAAALRTLDLSRQVGAALFSQSGEIVSLGSNEVPKANGGTYWCDEAFDDREYLHGVDSNDKRKREIITEIINVVKPGADIEAVLKDVRIKDSQFMDALEYGRIVHAEMSAISDAARLGLPTKGGTIHCTTFPCHMCAKHIIAAGVERVVFLEPYPKSLAFDLHADALLVEGGDRGKYRDYPAVVFEHFFGVTPRRYSDLFGRGARKNKNDSKLLPYSGDKGLAMPYINIKVPFYQALEEEIISLAPDIIQNNVRQ